MTNQPKTTGSTALGVVSALAIGSLVVSIVLIARSDGPTGSDAIAVQQIADLHDQGNAAVDYARDAARLERRDDGFTVEVDFPTPAAGTYTYPTADMIPPDSEPHPPVEVGDDSSPEVFTLWAFVFNQPQNCTDATCDTDDLGADAPAQGGIYQLDGRLAIDDLVHFGGTIRTGQPAGTGAPLFDPLTAEIHVAVAAHGRVLSGPDLWRQLNGAVGNPALWWAASFSAG